MRSGTASVVLLVPDEFAPRFKAALPAPVFVVADSSDSQTRKSADRLRLLLAGYWRAVSRSSGSRPAASTRCLPYRSRSTSIDVTTPSGRAVVVLGFMTYFVLFSVLMGGLYLAIDCDRGRARARIARIVC